MENIIAKYWLEFLLTLISGGLVFSFKAIYNKFKLKVSEVDCLKDGMRSLMRGEIIRNYNKYVEGDEYGYAPIYVKQTVEDMYKTYHALGGNGTITTLYNKIDALPTEKQD